MRKISLLFPAVALSAGCLSRPALVKESFAFASPPISNSVAKAGPVLGLRQVFVAPPFDSQAFTYRTGAFSYERDPYAGFLVSPEESLAEPVRTYFRNSGAFAEVSEPQSAVKPQIELEISVTQLYGDFRDRSHPAAILEMRLLAYQNAAEGPSKLILHKDYSSRILLQGRTAAALIAGWNEALRQLCLQAVADLNGVVKQLVSG